MRPPADPGTPAAQPSVAFPAKIERSTVWGEFTLSGWSPESAVRSLPRLGRDRRPLVMGALGVATGVAAATTAALTWTGPVDPRTLAVLGALAFLAQCLPVHVSHAHVSLGVGFLLAACLAAGPAAGAVTVAAVLLAWSAVRGRAPWFRRSRSPSAAAEVARAVFTAGTGAATYLAASTVAFAIFRIEPPVRAVTLETLGASVVLAVGVYLLQHLFSLGVAVLSGDDVVSHLRTVIPVPALAEFLALPAALLLTVTWVRLGGIAFALLAWLYLMAAFLGWRSWQDRATITQRLEDLELLHRVGGLLSETLELGELVRRMRGILREVVPFRAMLLTMEDTGERLSQLYAFDGDGRRAEVSTSWIEDTEGRPEGLFFESDRSSVYTRDLAVGEGATVRLRLDFRPEDVPDNGQLVLIETICRQAGTALSNARLYRLANTDPLTGVALRRYFERALRGVAARGDRFAVVMLDLDWFKQVNDAYGHRTGDLVLRDLANLLTGSLRALDVAARYGGEEFVILMPGTGSPEAAGAAERIRRSLDQRRLPVGGRSVRYTASFGVAASTDLDDATDPMEVVWRADAALLEAKRAGRNQVVTYAALQRRALDRSGAGALP